ncbi:rRNA maturation RNase YbeY [Williamsia herbipolensis]|uniref:Endoribonuclease YbeY n=1 Tax=Williamsia herbipolensis TaxID=1603258 RepID=A0AAU4K528_9NOCA|nr:rRNA maturation RNase YbeY [Williamsia herbipolensis]MCX6471141.1 rRNA maturation RNase YbeY [Mycobacteriales bacterium]
MSIEVSNESGVEVPERMLVDVAEYALGQMDVHPGAELSMVLVDNETMAELHLRWMDLPGPTDVMSFPMDELTPGGRPDTPDPGPAMLGDIVLCPEFAAVQAATARHPVEHELAVLTVHGVLHLLGYDHAEPDEEKEMFGIQGRIIDEWYADRRAADRARAQAAKDATLLNRIGFTSAHTPERESTDRKEL